MTTCVSAYESERNRSKSSWPVVQRYQWSRRPSVEIITRLLEGRRRRTGRIPQAQFYHLVVHLDHLHIILKHRRFTVNTWDVWADFPSIGLIRTKCDILGGWEISYLYVSTLFSPSNSNPQIEYKPLVNTVSSDVLKCNTTEKRRGQPPHSHTHDIARKHTFPHAPSPNTTSFLFNYTIHQMWSALGKPPFDQYPCLLTGLGGIVKKKSLLKISWTEDKFYQPQSPFEVIRPDIPFFFHFNRNPKSISNPTVDLRQGRWVDKVGFQKWVWSPGEIREWEVL